MITSDLLARRLDKALHDMIDLSSSEDDWNFAVRRLTTVHKAGELRGGVARHFLESCPFPRPLAVFKLNTGRIRPLARPEAGRSPLRSTSSDRVAAYATASGLA